MGARAKFLELVEANGWILDNDATVAVKYGRERKQDPYAFMKNAAHGGTWHIQLNYMNNTGWSTSYDERLRGVTVSYRNADGDLEPKSSWGIFGGNVGTLKKPGNYDGFNGLWVALGPGSLRERAEKLVRFPELAVWLTMETRHEHKLEIKAADEARQREREARAKPLPVTVDQGRLISEWYGLTSKLVQAAEAVKKADGMSNLPVLVAKMELALNDIKGVLTEEAWELAQRHYEETRALKESV